MIKIQKHEKLHTQLYKREKYTKIKPLQMKEYNNTVQMHMN